jgi:hypothetical protein
MRIKVLKQIADFVETRYIGQKDFTIVRYPATNNSLPRNNRFIFQCNVTRQPYMTKFVQSLCIKLYIL